MSTAARGPLSQGWGPGSQGTKRQGVQGQGPPLPGALQDKASICLGEFTNHPELNP